MFSNLLLNGIAALAFAVVANAVSTKAGSTVDVDGTFYYVPPTSVSSLGLSPQQLKAATVSGEDLIPLTVMMGDFSTFNASALETTIASFLAEDDVFISGFLQAVYIISSTPTELHTSLTSSLSGYDNKLLMVSSTKNETSAVSCTAEIPNGPYFLSVYTGEVYQAYRLYSDYEGAFTEGVVEGLNGNFSAMSASVPGVQSPTIGVPSRLYYTKTDDKPLAGVRLGTKDIYDVAGTRRGCGNRAYYDLYPEKNTTAFAVKRLIDAGAIIVGKMKTSQFANGAMATADWVDYHSPFNPRGDGYQDPSSSSSGPGAGIVAYPWLDLALGSDTGGSVRNPAQVNGAFGNRPTHGIVSLDNVMPLSPDLDTAGLLTRDAVLWKTAAEALYATNLTFYPSFPKKLYTTGFPTNASTAAESVLLSFLSKLEEFLNTTSSNLPYDAMWANSSLATQTKAPDLSSLLSLTYGTMISHQQYALLGLPFIDDYAAAHSGRRPFLDPPPAVRWQFAANGTTSLDQALQNRTIFKNWWSSSVILPDPETCSDSLLLYPGTLAKPNYRNQYLKAPGVPSSWSVQSISNLGGVPDMVIPVGQAPYNSTITQHEEFLPVAVDIIAAPGCDGVIFDLAVKLQEAGIINVPKTGSTMYRRDLGLNFE